jgi:hypothetical protein
MESKPSKYRRGMHVIYVDSRGVPRDATVTNWWMGSSTGYKLDGGSQEPGCNVAFVSGDPAREDSYGRQIERQTSLIHHGSQPAHGNYWCWERELSEEQRERLNAEQAS